MIAITLNPIMQLLIIFFFFYLIKTEQIIHSLRYGTDQVYFKSSDEMIKLFKNYKGAIEHTLEIDEKIDLKLDFE
ncbi:MAG: hypothetical protein MZV64_38735 [Ignavibacteriales bacterium]|nr:hypothetical protein [Ignavibacteriales bacterium]